MSERLLLVLLLSGWAVAQRPQEPTKPYPYREEEVGYGNKKAGVKLAGTLTLPRSDGPFPAVLLITGSGPQDRNATVAGHRPFLVLADYLTRRGIAILRMDDRGVGGSTGSVMESTSADFAEDVLLGVEYLKARQEINPRQIGLIGHSEGGAVAPLAASRSTDIAFIVLMAGPGLLGEKLAQLQRESIARASGIPEAKIARTRAVDQKMYAVVRSEKDNAAAEKKLREIVGQAMSEAAGVRITAAVIEAQFKTMLSPWYRFFITYDPVPTLKKVKCPVLAITGERDLQVPPDENLPLIAKALAAGRNSDFTIMKLPKLNHLFQTCQTGTYSEYSKLEETIAPIALDTIGDWILRRARP
jgi:pimeloyl-ACP methyl ester carboxylesterase